MTSILILDGNQRSALAVTRSLGKKGLKLYVADSTAQSLAGTSKYCAKNIQLPDINDNRDNFTQALISVISKHNIEIMLPMTDISMATILSQVNQFKNVSIPAPSLKSYNLASNKNLLFKLALKLDIPIPKTLFIDNSNKLEDQITNITYPIVIKPSQSRILINNKWISTTVVYANSRNHLIKQVQECDWLRSHPFMIQEYIKGEGQGIFTFYDKGKPIAFFAHKRLREKPPTGGVSVLRESIPVNPRMQNISEKLLENINWHGPAMVEFIVSDDGTPYLIEINGRFWGSLQLCIDSGIDFPNLAYLLAAGKPLPSNNHYNSHIRSRWLLGDLDHLYLVLKANHQQFSWLNKLSAIIEFLKFFQKNTHFEVNRLSDIQPFIYELKTYFKALK